MVHRGGGVSGGDELRSVWVLEVEGFFESRAKTFPGAGVDDEMGCV